MTRNRFKSRSTQLANIIKHFFLAQIILIAITGTQHLKIIGVTSAICAEYYDDFVNYRDYENKTAFIFINWETKMNIQSYWVYILYCENNTFYTGYTINLQKRCRSHFNGTAKCKFTRSFKPLYIAQCWQIQNDKSLAMKIERYIKKLSRAEKEEIIKAPYTLSVDPRIQPINRQELQLLYSKIGTYTAK